MGKLQNAINEGIKYYTDATYRTTVNATIATGFSSDANKFNEFLTGLGPVQGGNEGKANFLRQLNGSPGVQQVIRAYDAGQLTDAQLRGAIGYLETAYNAPNKTAWNNLVRSTPQEGQAVVQGLKAGRGTAVLRDLGADGVIGAPAAAAPAAVRPAQPSPAPRRNAGGTGRARTAPQPQEDPPPAPAAGAAGGTAQPSPAAAQPAQTDAPAPAAAATGPLGSGRYSREQAQAFPEHGATEKPKLQADIAAKLGGTPDAQAAAAAIVGELDDRRLGRAMEDPRWQTERTSFLDALADPANRDTILQDARNRPGAFTTALLSGSAETQLDGRFGGYAAFEQMPGVINGFMAEVSKPEHPLHKYESQLQNGFTGLMQSESGRAALLDANQQGGGNFATNMARFQEIIKTGQMGGKPIPPDQMDTIMNSFAEDPGKWIRAFGSKPDQFESALQRTATMEVMGSKLGMDFDNIGNWLQGCLQQIGDWVKQICGPVFEGLGLNNTLDGLFGDKKPEATAGSTPDVAGQTNAGPIAPAGDQPPASTPDLAAQQAAEQQRKQLSASNSDAPVGSTLTGAPALATPV